MFDIKLFEFETYNIRVVLIDDEPWFVGKDVAEVLGYKDTTDAIRTHVHIDDKQTRQITGGSTGIKDGIVINESGLYALIFGSKLEKAQIFKRWVTSELLPKLRKHGFYISPQVDNTQLLTLIQQLSNQVANLTERADKSDKLELKLEEKEIVLRISNIFLTPDKL